MIAVEVPPSAGRRSQCSGGAQSRNLAGWEFLMSVCCVNQVLSFRKHRLSSQVHSLATGELKGVLVCGELGDVISRD